MQRNKSLSASVSAADKPFISVQDRTMLARALAALYSARSMV
jgi:hypothetical protein